MKDAGSHKMSSTDMTKQDRLSFLLSMYSLTSSQIHSSLNILASIVIVANSALSFTAISRGWIGMFSGSIGIFVLSLVFYCFAVYSNFKSKKYITYILKNDSFELNKIIDEIEKQSDIFLKNISLSVILSIMFFIFIDITIYEHIL